MSFLASAHASANRPASLLKKHVVTTILLLIGFLAFSPAYAKGGLTNTGIGPVTGKSTASNGENQIEFKAGTNGIYTARASVCVPADTKFCTPPIVEFSIDVGYCQYNFGAGQRKEFYG